MADAKAQNRYRVLERLESGGMAEVFRGESESVAGFKKQVAIKRVLPHLASNDKFIRMFLDEARLSARLSHANIVQVFDIGHVENTYFIVMEYVDGVNLKAVTELYRKLGKLLPVPFACYVAMRVCEGLFYAHEATDSDGNTLGIVHRDVSPPNVLLSKRGEIKLVDFGLAKAAHSVEKTEPGVVKGKFSYLAPETAQGREADPQADIYACGIMLWEMLTNRRLFYGESDYQTVKMVQQGNIPSVRAIRPEIPADLEKVLLHALAKDKAQRFPNAQAFSEDISSFLFSHQAKVTAFDIATIVKEIVADRAAQARREGRTEVSVIDKLIAEEMLRFTSLGSSADNAPIGDPKPLAPDSLQEGSQPLDAGAFVNPGEWARELGDTVLDPRSLGDDGPSWDEPGAAITPDVPTADLADELEGEMPPAAPGKPRSTPEPSQSGEGIPLVRPRAGGDELAKPAGGRKMSGALLAILVSVLLVLTVGAGLYFAGIIRPH